MAGKLTRGEGMALVAMPTGEDPEDLGGFVLVTWGHDGFWHVTSSHRAPAARVSFLATAMAHEAAKLAPDYPPGGP
jgi:hypothetical protein